ncbi:MAG: hypothetical protein H7Z17_00325, partial [Fuerstia sp.]|nr:hypothetical protein [Fuerstiella sp.]
MQDPFAAGGEVDGTSLAIILAIYGVIFLVILGIQILICWQLSKLQSALPEQFRRHSPGMAFLMLVPFLNLVWVFIYPLGLSDGYAQFFNSQGVNNGDCNKQIALWWGICTVASIIPCLGVFLALASLVLMIMFFVKMFE